MKPAFAVCTHVIDGAQPATYQMATQGELGLACCEACAARGNEPGFKSRLWDAGKLAGFEIVPACSMGQLLFMARVW